MKILCLSAILAAAAMLVVGCGGGSPYDPGDVTNPVVTSGFTLSAPENVTVGIGETAVFPITVTKTLAEQLSRAEGDVSLTVSGLPDSTSATFTVNPVTPTLTGAVTELHVETGVSQNGAIKNGEIGPQTYTLTITGTDGTDTHSVTTTLTINPAQLVDDFSISDISDESVLAGQTAVFPITLTRLGQQGGKSRESLPVHLSATVDQAGAQKSFTVNPVLPTFAGAETKLRIKTGDQSGDFPVVITATDGVFTHTFTTTLHVSFPD